jgi:hypothetical protein
MLLKILMEFERRIHRRKNIIKIDLEKEGLRMCPGFICLRKLLAFQEGLYSMELIMSVVYKKPFNNYKFSRPIIF